MSAVISLSRETTAYSLDMAEIAVFVFGFFFLVGWIAEETTKDNRWHLYRTVFIVMAIAGVAGEWIADLAVFALSEHLQTISDSEVAQLKLDTQKLKTAETEARKAVAHAQSDFARTELLLADAHKQAAEANTKAEQFR